MSEEINSAVEVETDASYLSFLPGERLQKARELRGLTVTQVAQDLRLSERYVRAMEADDYSSLPEPAFVRGYMRRYAQLVKLSADDIVARFDESLGGTQVVETEYRKRRNPLQLLGDLSKRPVVNWTKLLSLLSLGLIVLVVLGTFWRNGSVRPAVQAVPAEVVAPTQAPAAVLMPPAVSGAVVAAAPAASAPVAAPALGTTLPTPSTSSATTPLPAIAPAPVTALPAPSTAAATPVTTDVVSFGFSGDCWLSVKDAAGKTLYEGTEKAGNNLSLTGLAPFVVNVGNASQATVSFNGKVVDLRPSTQGKSATLTLRR